MERLGVVVGGLVIGFLVALGLYLAFDDDTGRIDRRPIDELSFPALDHDPVAAADLVAAWSRWREATFVTSGTFTRTLDSGGDPLTGPSYRVQAPPRRLVVRLGSTIERVDDTVASCDADEESLAAPDCIAGDTSLTYDERVAAELLIVQAYVEGEARLYDVAHGNEEGCFQAELEVAQLAAPWGRWAEFCFDELTGALVGSRVRRASAVDVEDLRVVRSTVTDADFELSADD